jgi:acetyl-CoA acyltransferase 1
MGITSENVAARYGVSREEQDAFAVRSHQKAAAAIAKGNFKAEIVPITVTQKDPKTGASRQVTLDTDDGVRADTTVEGLAKLKAVFQKGGSTTAGNASQVTDGAAAVLAMKRSTAQKLGLPIQGVFRSFAVVGCAPDEMGVGPAYAIPPALKAAGLGITDIGVYEINEAFASQAVYCVKKLGIPLERVNPNGGAIALGHPLGCTSVDAVNKQCAPFSFWSGAPSC